MSATLQQQGVTVSDRRHGRGLLLQASAAGGVIAGNFADWLQEARRWKPARVRALTQTMATLGVTP